MDILIHLDKEEYDCVRLTGCIGNVTSVSNAILNGKVMEKKDPILSDQVRNQLLQLLKETYLQVGGENLNAITVSDCQSLTASRFRQVMIEKLKEMA